MLSASASAWGAGSCQMNEEPWGHPDVPAPPFLQRKQTSEGWRRAGLGTVQGGGGGTSSHTISQTPGRHSTGKREATNQTAGEGLEETFLQGRRSDGRRARGKMLPSISHRETQVKTTVRHSLTPTRLAIVKKPKTIKQPVLGGLWRNQNPHTLWVGTWKGVWPFLKIT